MKLWVMWIWAFIPRLERVLVDLDVVDRPRRVVRPTSMSSPACKGFPHALPSYYSHDLSVEAIAEKQVE